MSKPTKSLLLFIILFGAMLIFGFAENIKGVTFPLIKTELNISYEQQGVMVSLMSLSYMAFCFVGGIVIGSFGVKKAFALGFTLMILGLVIVFFMPGFWSLAFAFVVVFAGLGLFEVSCNALATQLFTFKAALLMSIMHFFYGMGSSLSPRAAGALSSMWGWRQVYLLCVPLALIFLIPSLLARFPQAEVKEGSEKTTTKKITFFTALKNPMVWIFAIALGFMISVELCSSNWAGLYFQDVYNMDPKIEGAAFISNFYILFTASRLLSGFAIEKIGYIRSLFIGTLAAVVILIVGFVLGPKGIYVLPGLGFCTAIFWPTMMAVAMTYFREDAPIMTSAIIVIAGALNSGVQFLMGLTNRLIGNAWGYRSALLYTILAVIALIVVTRNMRRPYKADAGRTE